MVVQSRAAAYLIFKRITLPFFVRAILTSGQFLSNGEWRQNLNVCSQEAVHSPKSRRTLAVHIKGNPKPELAEIPNGVSSPGDSEAAATTTGVHRTDHAFCPPFLSLQFTQHQHLGGMPWHSPEIGICAVGMCSQWPLSIHAAEFAAFTSWASMITLIQCAATHAIFSELYVQKLAFAACTLS